MRSKLILSGLFQEVMIPCLDAAAAGRSGWFLVRSGGLPRVFVYCIVLYLCDTSYYYIMNLNEALQCGRVV